MGEYRIVCDRCKAPHVRVEDWSENADLIGKRKESVVNDGVVIWPRGIREDMFAKGTTFTAAEIRQAIEPASDEVGPVGSTN